MVLLSGVKNFKAAFNSLCAYASVNHLHWHLYYLQHHQLRLETIGAKRWVTVKRKTAEGPRTLNEWGFSCDLWLLGQSPVESRD